MRLLVHLPEGSRRFRLALLVLCCVATACPPARPNYVHSASTRVEGRAVGVFGGLVGETVVIGSQRTVTDPDGRFSFANVPPTYDVAVLDRDRSAATVYRGLRRRDPLLRVDGTGQAADIGTGEKRMATIEASVSGGGPYPVHLPDARVQPWSPEALVTTEPGWKGEGIDAAGLNVTIVRWRGPESITARVFAMRTNREGDASPDGGPPGHSFWVADRTIRLRAGETAKVELPLTRAPMAHFVGRVAVAPGRRLTSLGQFSRLGDFVFNSANEDFHPPRSPFDIEAADLTSMGGTPCLYAQGNNGLLSTTLCGVRAGAAATLRLAEPPNLSSPVEGEETRESMKFAWSAFEGGVHRLRLTRERIPPDAPMGDNLNLTVYTAGTAFVWSDLRALGIAFPAGPARYRCRVEGFAPFADLDAYAAPNGAGDAAVPEIRKGDWGDIRVWMPGTAPAIEPTATSYAPPLPLAPLSPPPPPLAPVQPGASPVHLYFAQRMVGAAIARRKLPEPSRVVLGERWGCARFSLETGQAWQCWEANGASALGASLHARWVDWLKDQEELAGAPDHLCAFARHDRTMHCWERPTREKARGRELAPNFEWLSPQTEPFDPNAQAWREAMFVGATFSCLRPQEGDVWCVGDDQFGQLGAPRRATDAGASPPFVHAAPAQSVGLGTWHGCALAGHGGALENGAFVACWGRGDFGQLGAPASDVCSVGGRDIACARRPVAGPFIPGGVAAVQAGDLFSCVSDAHGIRCWGAARDGFFGLADSCPDSLKSAWPTLRGPVAAPHARCSLTPVRVAGSTGFDEAFRAGPRGLCFDGAHCAGGVPTPQGSGFSSAIVSPGDDASACAPRDGGVSCWGEAYARESARDAPVSIAFQPAPPLAELVVFANGRESGWGERCSVHNGCVIAPAAALAPCPPETRAIDWPELLPKASARAGHVVRVRGPLGLAEFASTLGACSEGNEPPGRPRNCCHSVGGAVVLGGASQTLALEGFGCQGDESQQCCNAPAYGEKVVATGRLERSTNETPQNGGPSGWRLVGATFCTSARP